MTEQTPEKTDVDPEQVPDADNRDQAPDQVDTSPRSEDGEQDVDQDPGYEEAESDETGADEDPAVHQEQ